MEPTDERRSEARPDEPERLTTPPSAPQEPQRLTMPPSAPSETGGVELDIGPRVTAVFTAAEKAAHHIVQMAREEAEDVRRRAEAEAETIRSQRRYQAEEDAARLVAEARAQADQIRSTAEEEARQMEESARRRELRIREETKLVEERVEWAREGLRDVLHRLREAEAVVTVAASEPASEASPRGDEPQRREGRESRTDLPPAAAMSGQPEPEGVEPGDDLAEPAERKPVQPW